MRTVWFMTGNAGKVREAKHALQPLGFDVVQLQVEGVEISEPQADDLEDVARSKIEQAIPHLPSPHDALLVEDAGLFVDSLDGFPGVYSAYALKTIGFNGLLNLLNDSTQGSPAWQCRGSGVAHRAWRRGGLIDKCCWRHAAPRRMRAK